MEITSSGFQYKKEFRRLWCTVDLKNVLMQRGALNERLLWTFEDWFTRRSFIRDFWLHFLSGILRTFPMIQPAEISWPIEACKFKRQDSICLDHLCNDSTVKQFAFCSVYGRSGWVFWNKFFTQTRNNDFPWNWWLNATPKIMTSEVMLHSCVCVRQCTSWSLRFLWKLRVFCRLCCWFPGLLKFLITASFLNYRLHLFGQKNSFSSRSFRIL